MSWPASWQSARRALRGYDRRLWILYGGFVASSMGFAMIVPFVSLYFHQELGVPMSVVGTFFLITAVVRASFQGYAGDLSDRVGRIRLMVSGQAARGVVFAGMVAVVGLDMGFWISAAVLLLSYIAGAFYQPVASAAVSDLVPAERRLDAFALSRVAHNLGWGVGPMLGGLVAVHGYAWLFLVGAVTSLFSAWLVRRFVSETNATATGSGGARSAVGDAPRDSIPRPDSGGGQEAGRGLAPTGARRRASWVEILEVRRDRRLLIYCGLILLVFLTMSQWLATLPVFASERMGVSTTRLGLMFGLNGFMVVVLQWPVTRGLRGITLVGSLILGSLVYSVSYLGFALASSYGHLVLGMAAVTLAELIVSPASVAMVSLIAPPGRMGRYMGVYSLATSFVWSVGPFVGGILLDLWIDQPWLLWGTVASFSAVAALGFWRTRRLFPEAPPSAQSGASAA